jgi:hypothetical protein
MSIEEDFLEVDKPIPGQNYVCITFLSPESVIKSKELFLMKKFLHSVVKKEDFLKVSDEVTEDQLLEEYDNFKFNNEKKLNDEFDETNKFQTSVRGMKVRGVYDSLKEAQIRAKVLQRKDPNFNVFVGQVGYWLPWDPNAEHIDNQEYQESELNELMYKYKENVNSRDELYEKEKQEKQKKIIAENKKRREENERLKKEADEQQLLDKENEPEDTSETVTEVSGVPTDTPDETITKINEFRKILDEKDKILEDARANSRNNSSTTEDIIDYNEGVEESKSESVDNTISESNKNLKDIVNSIF